MRGSLGIEERQYWACGALERRPKLAVRSVENSVTTTKNPFSIEIALRHPSYSPESISAALSVKPLGSHAVGDRFAGLRAGWTSFFACLQKGNDVSEFEGALAHVAIFLEKNAAFWAGFIGGNGEVELILNHTIYPQEEEGDKCFELHIAPAFLAHLSTRGIGLRVQGWQGRSKQEDLASSPR
jgi:hypothetical protein